MRDMGSPATNPVCAAAADGIIRTNAVMPSRLSTDPSFGAGSRETPSIGRDMAADGLVYRIWKQGDNPLPAPSSLRDFATWSSSGVPRVPGEDRAGRLPQAS